MLKTSTTSLAIFHSSRNALSLITPHGSLKRLQTKYVRTHIIAIPLMWHCRVNYRSNQLQTRANSQTQRVLSTTSLSSYRGTTSHMVKMATKPCTIISRLKPRGPLNPGVAGEIPSQPGCCAPLTMSPSSRWTQMGACTKTFPPGFFIHGQHSIAPEWNWVRGNSHSLTMQGTQNFRLSYMTRKLQMVLSHRASSMVHFCWR